MFQYYRELRMITHPSILPGALKQRSFLSLCLFALLTGCATQAVGPDKSGKSNALREETQAHGNTLIAPGTPIPAFEPTKYVVKAKEIESTSEQLVRGRALSRWNHLIKAELDEAYEYLSPGSRLANPKQTYKNRIQSATWRGADIVRVECNEPERCLVQVNVKSRLVLPRVGSVNHGGLVSEDWLYSDNQWWFVVRNP
jgi:hypothetical protein